MCSVPKLGKLMNRVLHLVCDESAPSFVLWERAFGEDYCKKVYSEDEYCYTYTHIIVDENVRPGKEMYAAASIIYAPHLIMLQDFKFKNGVWIRKSAIRNIVFEPLPPPQIYALGPRDFCGLPPTKIVEIEGHDPKKEKYEYLTSHDFSCKFKKGLRYILLTRLGIIDDIISENKDFKDTLSSKKSRELVSYDTTLLKIKENLKMTESMYDFRPRFESVIEILCEKIIGNDDFIDSIIKILHSVTRPQTFFKFFNNMAIMGASGIGKTHSATIAGDIFRIVGLSGGDPVILTRGSIVKGYIGQTAINARKMMLENINNFIIIDEAYQLVSGSEHSASDFGYEAVSEIVNFMDKYVGCYIIAICGYEDKTRKQFFGSNEGLERRFPLQITLNNPSSIELAKIFARSIEPLLGEDISTRDYLASVVYHSLECGKIMEDEVDVKKPSRKLNAGRIINFVRDIGEEWNISITPNFVCNIFEMCVNLSGSSYTH